jgi:uncharacterized membrane protein YbhN (UPF0104 family)
MNQPPSTRSRIWPLLKLVLHVAILALVGWGVWRTVEQARAELVTSGITLRDLHFGWLVISGITYLIGMLPWALFWYRVLLAMHQRPRRWESMRAYAVSQPGKYVPGKFMVVALRSAMIRSENVDLTISAAASFVETLTVMSLGAVVGALLLPAVWSGDWWLEVFAIGAAIGVGLPTLPPVLQRLAKLTRMHRLHPEIDRSFVGLSIRRLVPGWIAIVLGWFSMGASLGATLLAMPGHLEREVRWTDLAMLTACVALSTVAGFVSGLPGGLVAREWVVMALVKPHFGATAAILSALINRCVMIAAELIIGGIMLVLRRRRPGG